MSLAHDIRDICTKYAPLGWAKLFSKFGVDILISDPTSLVAELTAQKQFSDEARRLRGFEDLSLDASRAVEPGEPSESLLYHAFASPLVTEDPDGVPLQAFPTLAELQTLENFVYGVQPPTLDQLAVKAQQLGNTFRVNGRSSLAIVVFAHEYRPKPATVHKRHADKVYSRSGVARIGTEHAVYDPKRRGFWAAPDGNSGIRVIPSQWASYLTVLLRADHDFDVDVDRFGPMRPLPSDHGRSFWVPIHKLFSGDECIGGLNLEVKLFAEHINQKIHRIHKYFESLGIDGGFQGQNISAPPFVFREEIAEFSSNAEHGLGVLIPIPHDSLVEEAKDENGNRLDFIAPPPVPGRIKLFESSLELRTPTPGRPVPEYLHIRHTPRNDGGIDNLNDDVGMSPTTLLQPGRRAVHYVDFTGDGWVSATVSANGAFDPPSFPAYSLVSAPDFYPACDQRELLDWHSDLPAQQRALVAWFREPETLSDDRMPPDPKLALEGGASIFDPSRHPALRTITAVVAGIKTARRPTPFPVPFRSQRHGFLPDSCAGLFAPGWAISEDVTDGVRHLASYGLGSPFPEDAKLCAALSAFWPAVAPDTTRSFLSNGNTIAPMTDEEISGASPWDGISGPSLDTTTKAVNYPNFFFADYVDSALAGTMTLNLTSLVDADEYQRRVLTMGRVRDFVSRRQAMTSSRLSIVSFRKVPANDVVVVASKNDTQVQLQGDIYHFRFADVDTRGSTVDPNNHRRRTANYTVMVEILSDDSSILTKDGDTWTK